MHLQPLPLLPTSIEAPSLPPGPVLSLPSCTQAINRMDMVCVPLYDTLGDEAVQYIIKHSEAKLIISAASKLQVGSAGPSSANNSVVTTCALSSPGSKLRQAMQRSLP